MAMAAEIFLVTVGSSNEGDSAVQGHKEVLNSLSNEDVTRWPWEVDGRDDSFDGFGMFGSTGSGSSAQRRGPGGCATICDRAVVALLDIVHYQ